MKRKIKYFTIIVLSALVVSCGQEVEAEATEKEIVAEDTEMEEVINPIIEEDVVDSKYIYDKDWEHFKEAVINKDIQGVSGFASSDEIDAEIIVDAFSDPEFLELLKAATYNDLETNTDGPEVLLVFSASLSGYDEEGNEYESGLYLYFSQGEMGLLLENFLAAG